MPLINTVKTLKGDYHVISNEVICIERRLGVINKKR